MFHTFPDGVGMLFVFNSPGQYSFWMKDMHFPLDMVWIDSDKIVADISRNAYITQIISIYIYTSASNHLCYRNECKYCREFWSQKRRGRQFFFATLILVITVTDCKVRDISEGGYVSGSLDAYATLYRVSSGEKLWPTTEKSRLVQVGFESERRGRDAAVVRLAAAASHCITRYLYNCPKADFKISDERTASGW